VCFYGAYNWNRIKEKICGFPKPFLLACELYICWSLVGVYIIHNSSTWVDFVYFAVSMIWVRISVQLVIVALSSLKSNKRKADFRIYIVFFILEVSITLLFLKAFNPAITGYDSQNLYRLAKLVGNESFTMLDWHPPFYVFVMGAILRCWDNISFLIIIQVICFWLIISRFLYFLNKKGLSFKIVCFLFFMFGVLYNNQLQLITLWKDIPYTICMIWLTMLLSQLVLDKQAYANNLFFYFEMFFALLGVALFRQNGILAVGIIVFVVPLMIKNKKAVLAMIAVLLAILIIKGPIYKANNIVKQPSLKYYSLCNDILYVYYTGVKLDDETLKLVLLLTDAEKDRTDLKYNPYYGEYYHADLSDYKLPEFIKLYIRNFIQNPRAMTQAVLMRTQIIWSISKSDDETISCVNYIGELNSEGLYPLRNRNILTKAFTKYVRTLEKSNLIYIVCWRPGIYNALIIIGISFLLCKFYRKKNYYYLLPYIPVFFGTISLFLASAWPDYRYHWPNTILGVLLVCYCIVLNQYLE